MTALSVAISPCPNDTFIFGSWILGHVPGPQNQDSRFFWHDVQELNQGALHGAWDIVKVSAATAVRLTDKYCILSCGGAFGLEHGPKLVIRADFDAQPRTIAVPGLDTTAMCVLRAALGPGFTPVPMIFHAIVQAVLSGEVDAGLLIHETALVYDQYGLKLHTDLGQWWHTATNNLPLPLGCIVLRNSLQTLRPAVEATIRASILRARTHPHDTSPLVAALARELDEATLRRHIAAYVNDFSLDMGALGQAALSTLQTFGTHA
ncbi:1,4-dihydroxy-6-naphthoate synthase [Desulfovibrionales bacterium]